MTLPLSITFVLYFLFVATLVRWSSNFQGASRAFKAFLNVYCFISAIGCFAFLIYFGWTTVWYYPVIFLIAGGIVAAIFGAILDSLIGLIPMSLISLVGIPVSGFFLAKMVI